jgi:pyridinium-3,5-biscarboxylic acid mononucleotide synthase
MDHKELQRILGELTAGKITPAQAETRIAALHTVMVGDVNLDTDRECRTGAPEVIYAEGKEPDTLVELARHAQSTKSRLLMTRLNAEAYRLLGLHKASPDEYHQRGRVAIWWGEKGVPTPAGRLVIVTAGTTDMAVAEEAFQTARFLGLDVVMHGDVGVAGLHRLFHRLEDLQTAQCIIAIAGMEGALPSVVAGLVSAPVVAVPTSVGYGAAFGGITALLAMLNSCSGGVGVVNIDNGFGAALLAYRVIRAGEKKE